MNNWDKLDAHLLKINSLRHASSILMADEATVMPKKGAGARANALSDLAAFEHQLAGDERIEGWIEKAYKEVKQSEQIKALKLLEEDYKIKKGLKQELVKKSTKAFITCEQEWRKLRGDNNWKGLEKSLQEVLNYARELASVRASILGLNIYDACLDQYSRGLRENRVDDLFAKLKSFLRDFIPKAVEHSSRRPQKKWQGPFELENQKKAGVHFAKYIGLDLEGALIGESSHPFCGGVSQDIRLTTRYRQDEFLSSLMGIMHETGHALYEQGLPLEWQHWPVGQACGMALHESQSLFMENCIARSDEFWKKALPELKKILKSSELEGLSLEDFLSHLKVVRPSKIRVDADEVTYPMHIILRFEIERDLVKGNIQVKDIPELWHHKMREYLGVETQGDYKDGPMQDVHWVSGAFGYFPCYTLGAIKASQFYDCILKQIPNARELIEEGDFSLINQWRAKHIWHKASFETPQEIVKSACQEELNQEYFCRYLQDRYYRE